MSYLRRILARMLGIASPSRIMAAPTPRTWLERWERRIDARAGWPPPIRLREEVIGESSTTGDVMHFADVTGRSDRAQRRVRNTWRRRRPDLDVKIVRLFE